MLAVWLRAAARACRLDRGCPAAGAPGTAPLALDACGELAGGLGSSANIGAGGVPCDALVGVFLMPTVVQEPLSGDPPSMTSISDDTEKASARHAAICELRKPD